MNKKLDGMELEYTHIKAIDLLRNQTRASKVRFKTYDVTIVKIEGMGDSQKDGEYVAGTLYIIEGKIYHPASSECFADD